MRNHSFDPVHLPQGSSDGHVLAAGGAAPPVDYTTNLPVPWRPSRWRWVMRGLAALLLLLIIAIAWLMLTAPLSKSLLPPVPPSITLVSAEGVPIARRGATVGEPVDAAALPPRVTDPFLAIEDRSFRSHWGISLRGMLRAAWANVVAGGVRQGASTITQQLAKNAFLDSDRTAGRKLREILIAFWLEAWLSKDEILSRYLSNVYFGDNVYGLDAAARHYFSRAPADLSAGQAAMLAGLVKAPSRLAPTSNLKGARDRQKLVVAAMADAGFITDDEAAAIGPASLRVKPGKTLPNGTYFADWVLPAAREQQGEIGVEETVKTTLEMPIQRAAERAVRSAGLKTAQVAIVVMRPDGRVVAMVGGKNYATSSFNRATQARRQPGSTFKLFVYLAALRSGMTPDSMVDDEPVTIGEWSPKNSDGRYLGRISLTQAFARSSNVAAARLTKAVGPRAVIRAARDLGISTPIPDEASIALGTATVSLLELTSAYAAIAEGRAPVRPHGLAEVEGATSWLDRLRSDTRAIDESDLDGMRTLLSASISRGTGRGANLAIAGFGKTGTTQDNRDALFIGYAGGLVTGVWMGNDDNTPNPGLAGGGMPARIWRNFMTDALRLPDLTAPAPDTLDTGTGDLVGDIINGIEEGTRGLGNDIDGLGLNLRLGTDGTIETRPPADRRMPPPPDSGEPRARAQGPGDEEE